MSDDQAATAHEIAERLLTQTGDALMAADFERLLPCFRLPYEVRTISGQRLIENEAEMRTLFDAMVDYYRMQNVTHLVRKVVQAEFQDTKTIHSAHVTRLVSGSMYTQDPYPVTSVLRRTEGGWQGVASEYGVRDAPFQIRLLSGANKI